MGRDVVAHDSSLSFDVVVVGSGVAGLTAAVTAAVNGLSVVVVERSKLFGGTSAVSGGAIWVPNNPHLKAICPGESREEAERYLEAIIGNSARRDRWQAYLDGGAQMVEEMAARTKWVRWRHVPFMDYHAQIDGASPVGRTLGAPIIDGRLLGEELQSMRRPVPAMDVKGLPITLEDFFALNMITRHSKGKLALARLMGKTLKSKIRGEKPLAFGQAMMARLRLEMLDLGIPLWLETGFLELLGDQRRVSGVRVRKGGEEITLTARHGVVLAAGGFTASPELRNKYLPQPTNTDWSLAPAEGQEGDALNAAIRIGAATDELGRAWGIPVTRLPAGDGGALTTLMLLTERALPGTFIVDGQGERYLNEAQLYDTFFTEMYRQADAGRSIAPSWFIFDARAKRRYLLFGIPPMVPFPRRWIREGHLKKAATLAELARLIDVPAATLSRSVERYNDLCRKGTDDDFGKGTPYDRYYGDPTLPHPNLAPLERGPFYAVAVYPGDFNTKGGLRADGNAQVENVGGMPIEGLYAVGNTSCNPWGDTYPGPGGTLGPAAVFGYLAAKDISSKALNIKNKKGVLDGD